MKFGQLTKLDGVDLSLPPVDERSREVLAGRPSASPAVHAGCTGWTCREWVGRVYPPGATGGELLVHYGRQFNTVEMNTTHYRVPTPETVRRWRESVPEGFRFSPKFPQEVSHAPDLSQVGERARVFCERMLGLGDRLGRSFLQLPPEVGPRQAGALVRLLDAVPEGLPLAVEFRHPAWFNRGRLIPLARGVLAERQVVAVMTDVAGRRDVLHGTLTAPGVMVRFVGNGLHPTDFTRMHAWSLRLKQWLEEGLEEVFFFMHQPDNLVAAHASNALVQRLNAVCGLSLPEWHPPAGEQLSLL
jgi:uncharacterized protein YecE (DUF72 family)